MDGASFEQRESDRSALGCDCATILNSEKAAALYNAGYRYVGRYVSGGVGSGATATSKALTRAEMTAIFNAGLKILPFTKRAVSI